MENVARLGGDRVLYSSPNIIRAIKSEGMIRAGREKNRKVQLTTCRRDVRQHCSGS